jgi:hypothetical protein
MTEINANDKLFCLEFLNFLEVFIHSILYLRDVYPRESFYGYEIYNTKYRFNVDDTISSYIQDFLNNLENALMLKIVKKIYICIINANDNSIIEIFNIDVKIPNILDFRVEQLRLYLKSILSTFWFKYVNKISLFKNNNTKFHLCVEMKDTKIISDYKIYKEILLNTENHYIKNILTDDFLEVYKNFELCVQDSEFNSEITIYRNFKK